MADALRSCSATWAAGDGQRETQGDGQGRARQGRAGVARVSQSQTAAKWLFDGDSTESTRLQTTECGAFLVSSLAPSVRSALRTAIRVRAPPHCLVRRRILTRTRHSARPDSPEAAERWCQAYPLPTSTTQFGAASDVPWRLRSFFVHPLFAPSQQMTPTVGLSRVSRIRGRQERHCVKSTLPAGHYVSYCVCLKLSIISPQL